MQFVTACQATTESHPLARQNASRIMTVPIIWPAFMENVMIHVIPSVHEMSIPSVLLSNTNPPALTLQMTTCSYESLMVIARINRVGVLFIFLSYQELDFVRE